MLNFDNLNSYIFINKKDLYFVCEDTLTTGD